MSRARIDRMCPFFIVSDVPATIAFYRDRLGFELWHGEPADLPFFAIMGRDGAMLFVKAGETPPLPNSVRDPAMRWDAYLTVADPDALAAEYAERGAPFAVPLQDMHDGLRGFEIRDIDGYVLFFGRPAL